MHRNYSISRSVVSEHSHLCLRSSHILLFASSLLACITGVEVAADTGDSNQQGDLTPEPLNKTLIASEEGLSLARTVAQTIGIESLRRFVTKDAAYAERLGFESLSQVTDGNLVALPPFPVFRIGLTQLQSYDGNAAMLFSRKRVVQFVVPIAVEGKEEALSAITVRLGGDKKSNKIIQWGARNLIRQLSRRRGELAKDKDISSRALFVIEIPALNRLYLGYTRASGKIMLIPVAGAKPSEGIVEQPIEDLLRTLAIEARAVDEKPR